MLKKVLLRPVTLLALACCLNLPTYYAFCPVLRQLGQRRHGWTSLPCDDVGCESKARRVEGGVFSSLSIILTNHQRLGSLALQLQSVHLTDWLRGALEEAFSNERFTAPPEGVCATARHILLPSEEACLQVARAIRSGSLSFERAAMLYSSCPTKHDGGSLGRFHRGTMVPEFDTVVFNPSTPLRQPIGPIKTPFGYHIVVVDKRTGV